MSLNYRNMALLKWWSKGTVLLQKAARLTWRQWLLLIEAGGAICIAWLRLKLLPLRRVAATWGEPQRQAPPPSAAPLERRAEQVGWAVRAINHCLPWQDTCLIQAMAARQMLRRRQIANVLYFGVRQNTTKPIDAHAWLSVGQHVLTGKRGHRQFSILSVFVDENMENSHEYI